MLSLTRITGRFRCAKTRSDVGPIARLSTGNGFAGIGWGCPAVWVVTTSIALPIALGAERYDLLDYYHPMVAGNEWVYESQQGSSTWTTTCRILNASVPLNCYSNCAPVVPYTRSAASVVFDQGGGNTWTNFMHVGAPGFGYVGFDHVDGTRLRFGPEFIYTNRFALGQMVSVADEVYSGGVCSGQGSQSIRLLGLAEVTVPYGSFTDCLHLEITSSIGGSTTVDESWWAKGMGPVKWTHGGGGDFETNELRAVSFAETVRLVDYYPLPLNGHWLYQGLDWDGFPAKSVRRVDATNTLLTLYTGRNPATSYTTNVISEYNSYVDSTTLVPYDEWTSYMAAGSSFGHFGDSGAGDIRLDRGGILPEFMAVGDSITNVVDAYIAGTFVGTVSFIFQVLEHTAITVPAGTFPEVLRVRIATVTPGDAGAHDEWWAKSVGSIKEVGVSGDGMMEQWELIEYSVPLPPAIETQPEDRTNSIGTTATFQVGAVGAEPLTYQWRFNGTNLTNGGHVAGATSSTLTLSGVQASDAGNYTVVVTNAYGSVTSSLAVLTVESPAPFAWARRVASTVNPDTEPAIGMTLDSQGNVYVTGWFDGTNDFGGVTLTNNSGGGQDIFVAKYDSGGALQWARRAGGSTAGWDAGRGVGVDTNGNVYVTGGFYGTADFGTFNLTASQNGSFFLAKYNSAGAVQWVRQSVGGSSAGVYGTGLAVDGVGNSYAVGFAHNGTTISFGTMNLLSPSASGFSTFLVKSDNVGTVKWAQLMGGPDHTYATKVAVDASGNVYVHGGFSMDMAIGSSHLISAGDYDRFLAKFDNAGALIWVQQEGGAGDEGGDGGVAVDPDGNVYDTGAFGSSPMNFGSTSLTNAGSWDAFIAKYNSSGLLQWARRAGGTNLDAYLDVALDGVGNVYAAGVMGSDAVAPNGTGGAMVAKYDPAGTLQWAYSASGPPADPVGSMVNKCAVDSAGNCYLAGWYQGTVTFGTNVLQPEGYWNYFLARLSPVSDSLQFGSLSVSDGVFQMRLGGAPGASVVVDNSLNLTTWTPWQTNTLPSGGLNVVVPMGTNRQFFRARIP